MAETKDQAASEVLRIVRDDPVSSVIAEVCEHLGGDVYAVGGVVRDVVRGYEPEDIDMMVRGLSKERLRGGLEAVSKRLDGRLSEVGKSFGIFEVRCPQGCVQVSLPRLEHSLGHHHKDFEIHVAPDMSVEDDLLRRDYTCNAMAVGMDGTLHDPLGGFGDTKWGLIRATNEKMIAEDPLRIVRALSLVSRRRMFVGPVASQLIMSNADKVGLLPPDRIRNELDKIFKGDRPDLAMKVGVALGVLQVMLPEFVPCVDYNQNNKHHSLILHEHMIEVLRRICLKTGYHDLRLAAFLHDIGKPASAWIDPETGYSHFYKKLVFDDKKNLVATYGDDHQVVGADIIIGLMTRLNYSTDRIRYVANIVRHHMYHFADERGAKRFLNRVGGAENAFDLIALRWADSEGKGIVEDKDKAWHPDTNRRLIGDVLARHEAFSRKDLAIGGTDIVKHCDVEPGPIVGEILNELMEAVIDDPSVNTREQLIALAVDYYRHVGNLV